MANTNEVILTQLRITPEEVRAAYLKTQLAPLTGIWLECGGGCAITALYLAENPILNTINDDISEITKWADNKYGQNYVQGFLEGFDNEHINNDEDDWFNTQPADYKLGFQDGVAANKEMFCETT